MKNYSSMLSALQHIVEQPVYLHTKPSRIQCSGTSRYVEIIGFPQVSSDSEHMVPLKLVNIKSELNLLTYVHDDILLCLINYFLYSSNLTMTFNQHFLGLSAILSLLDSGHAGYTTDVT